MIVLTMSVLKAELESSQWIFLLELWVPSNIHCQVLFESNGTVPIIVDFRYPNYLQAIRDKTSCLSFLFSIDVLEFKNSSKSWTGKLTKT